MLVGSRLKELRLKKGLSQEDVGNNIGVTKVAVCGYEKGIRNPTLKVFLDIVDLFETNTDYLLGRDVLISEEETDYKTKLSKEDLKILKELKENNKLYNRLLEDSKRTIELINRKIN